MEVPKIVEIDDLWWPASDWASRAAIEHDMAEMVDWFRRHVLHRDIVVQAGGNVGCYPRELAKIFNAVITVEPDPVNFLCLEHNIAKTDVHAMHCAFGEKAGGCKMQVVDPYNCGAHQIVPGDEIAVTTIDMLDLPVSAIWLDVEGYELKALKGAQKTIELFHPVIATEEKGLGGHPDGAIAAWLEKFGYQEFSRHCADRLYMRVT